MAEAENDSHGDPWPSEYRSEPPILATDPKKIPTGAKCQTGTHERECYLYN